MVLGAPRSLAIALLPGFALVVPSLASAQALREVTPAIPRVDSEYEPIATVLGGVTISLEVEPSIEYDNNIFATSDDPTEDVSYNLRSQAVLSHQTGNFTASLTGDVDLRRYFEETGQNADAGGVEGTLVWSPRTEEVASIVASIDRVIEDRGDPEARVNPDLGPRAVRVSSVEAGYRRARGKLLFDFGAEATEFDALSPLDDDRDFFVAGGIAKLGVRVAGQAFATASAFYSNRDFRLETSPQGVNRDAQIYGGRLGVDFLPGGLFEGGFSVGVFRNEPEDPSIAPRTGLSLDGLLTFYPRRRMALIFEASRGDVATFRGGAAGRTDTSARVTWQHEIRHNLFSSLSLGYLESNFEESNITQETVIARGEIEYLIGRNVSVLGNISFGDRDSDLALEEFDRRRGGISLRFRF